MSEIVTELRHLAATQPGTAWHEPGVKTVLHSAIDEIERLRLALAAATRERDEAREAVRGLLGPSESYRRALDHEHFYERQGRNDMCDDVSHKEGEHLLEAIGKLFVSIRPPRTVDMPNGGLHFMLPCIVPESASPAPPADAARETAEREPFCECGKSRAEHNR